ncbi:hypothetical protein QCA50_017772 [Cerrena zonata]|uniref:Uncharacterized protein n=1 Tax=Cerrena zonata TaxID=2478898 RepID=A0AAW0FLW8_9APHY
MTPPPSKPLDPSQWCGHFQNVFWSKHCLIVSNMASSVALPPGNGLTLNEEEVFHLSLLTQRIWGQDNFWYLALLPRYPSLAHDPLFRPLGIPFHQLPIEQVGESDFRLQKSIANVWLQLEHCLIDSYNILKEHFLPSVPLRTRVPPYPHTTNFHLAHTSEDAARRAAHRTRRIFLAWLCLLSCAIASSHQHKPSSPPAWYKALTTSSTVFPSYWLDKVVSSPILTSFSPNLPRRGMVVNMLTEWGFWALYHIFETAGIPLWLCFPHGTEIKYSPAKYLLPLGDMVRVAKQKFELGEVCEDSIDDVQYLPEAPAAFPLPYNYNERDDDEWERRGSGQTSNDLYDSQSLISQAMATDGRDALSVFFRKRKETIDARDARPEDVECMRSRGKTLLLTSKLFEWHALESFPWFERRRVPGPDRHTVWNLYTPHQRLYDGFADEWDCVAQFAPLEDVDCAEPGCRDDTHAHMDEIHDADKIVYESAVLPSHLRYPHSYDPYFTVQQGECSQLSFTRAYMEGLQDVLRYRYGLYSPQTVEQMTTAERREREPRVVEALRAMVQEQCINEFQWQTDTLVSLLLRFWEAIKTQEMVPLTVSDCHMADEEFDTKYNAWGLTVTKGSVPGGCMTLYGLITVNSRLQGWIIAVHSRTTVREVLRRRWGPGNAQIGRALLERGIPFRMLLSKPLSNAYIPVHLTDPLYRLEGRAFTADDYKSYVVRRLELFKYKSIATAALRCGGILWRLALESNVDINNAISTAEEDEMFNASLAYNGPTLMVYDFLPEEIVEAIVGVYKVYTGKGDQTKDVSWWPKQHTWDSSGFNCGHWTVQCEEWFGRRVEAVVAGKAAPRKPKEWQSALRLRLSTTKNLLRGLERSIYEEGPTPQ